MGENRAKNQGRGLVHKAMYVKQKIQGQPADFKGVIEGIPVPLMLIGGSDEETILENTGVFDWRDPSGWMS